jgi:hypothetical protein
MRHGTRVRFIGCDRDQINWGGCDDPNPVLFKDTVYYIERVDVHTWHSKIELRGIKGKFNSVCFEEV